MTVTIRPESPDDVPFIRTLVQAAFADAEHSDGTEHLIVDRLRENGTLSVSLVAIQDGHIIGHVAASPVSVDGWCGIAPLAVAAECRKQGVGKQLMEAVIDRLRTDGADVAVLLGEPEYYGRFGFTHVPDIKMDGLPEEAAAYFQTLPLNDVPLSPHTISYDRAFNG